MKTLILTLALSFFGFVGNCNAQVKEYYLKAGTIESRARSGNKMTFQCKMDFQGRRTEITNANDPLPILGPSNIIDSTKSAGPMMAPDFAPVEKDHFHKIVKEVINEYSYDIYMPKEWRDRQNVREIEKRRPDYPWSLLIFVTTDTKTAKITNIEFSFSNSPKQYAGRLPIEVYQEIDNRFRSEVKCHILPEGKNQHQGIYSVYARFKPQPEDVK